MTTKALLQLRRNFASSLPSSLIRQLLTREHTASAWQFADVREKMGAMMGWTNVVSQALEEAEESNPSAWVQCAIHFVGVLVNREPPIHLDSDEEEVRSMKATLRSTLTRLYPGNDGEVAAELSLGRLTEIMARYTRLEERLRLVQGMESVLSGEHRLVQLLRLCIDASVKATQKPSPMPPPQPKPRAN